MKRYDFWKQGDFIKKLTNFVILVIIVSILAGCGSKPEPNNPLNAFAEEDEGPIKETKQSEPITGADATPLAIYSEKDGTIVKLGDKREDVEKIFGDHRMIMEFEEEKLERVDYWDFPGVYVEYDIDGIVRSIRLDVDAVDWKIFNGVKTGNSIEAMKGNYPEHMYSYLGMKDRLVIAYDKDGKSAAFKEEQSEYFVRFNILEEKVEMIVIQDNTIYL